MTEASFQIKKKQYLYAVAAGAAGLGLIGLLIWSVDDKPSPSPISSEPTRETHITTAGQRINPQEIWVERIESDNKLTNQKLETLEKLMVANAKTAGEAENKVQKLESELDHLRHPENATGEATVFNPTFETLPDNALPPSTSDLTPSHPSMESGSGIRKIVLKLSNQLLPGQKKVDKSTLENTLPAGTFARAILLGGVDASTSVSAPSDPRPVLLRIADPGTLPRKFKSDLKACHVLASSYGDLSSERVYMRLEKLTCTERLTGEISETVVAGYVVGEDGKAGVRGVVVDKSGPIIRNSLVGGFFSGIGKFFESQNHSFALPIVSSGTNPLSTKQILMSGASSGASQAMEKYADFFIKRAEQLQPVLQVAAGREVDIVFTQGTRFGETSVRKTLSKIRNRSRQQAVQNLEASEESQNWLPENPQNGDTQ